MSSLPGTDESTELQTTDLRICLLGPPNAEWPSHTLDIPRRQARALLYHLAVQLQPIPRERLCFLFWPDTPESSARRNLSRLLTHLRRALPAPEILISSGDHVGLDPRRTWSDTTAFQRLRAAPKPQGQAPRHNSGQAPRHGSGQAPRHGSGQALQQAVDLYRGPFLAGFSLPDCPEFEAWATLERETWERLYLETLATLIEDRAANGEQLAAIAHARRYLETDEMAENVHRRLIELYAATGDRSAALRQFERCVTVLERELGVSPLPETQAAYRAAQENRPASRSTLAPRPMWATLPGLDMPLVGREGALRQLERAYAKAQTGQAGVVLISGEPGIGKSRLIQDFATRLQDHAVILAGAGYPDTQTIPYQPVIEALRPALSARHFSSNPQLTWLAEASRLMPELRTLYPNMPPPIPESYEARARLFEALCRLTLGLAAGSHAVLLCLDNLHWADSTTLDWLAYLGRQLQSNRLLVIGAYREEEADAIAGLRHGLSRQGILSDLKIVGLDNAAVLQLLQHLWGSGSSPLRVEDKVLARRLQEATGGNPFFLLETLQALAESGRGLEDLNSLEDLPLPDTIRDAVDAHMERLSPMARQVLEAGAVMGQTFGFDTVHLTAGRQEMETMDSLDELVARQLLTEQAAGYRFRHEIVREAVYRNLSTWRRRLLHRRAGEAIERLHPGDVAGLAWHFERAEEPGQAARYGLQAGQAAKEVFAHTEARAYFDRALTLLEQEAAHLQDPETIAANQRLQIQALHDRGWALRLLGDMEAYARDLQEVARLAELLDDQRTLAHLRYREAYTHRWFCRYAQALEAAEEGIRLSQAAADTPLEALCWREVGRAARATGDYDRAQATLERALSLFADLDDVVLEIHTLGNLSTLYWCLGEYERAMDLARQSLARSEEAELPLERRLGLGDVGATAAAMGDVDLARRCLMESLSIARQIADRTQEIICLGHLGWLCVRERQPAEALEHLQAALAIAEDIGSCTEQSWLHSGLAEAYRLAEDLDQALTHARRALEIAQTTQRAYDEGLARRILTELREVDL